MGRVFFHGAVRAVVCIVLGLHQELKQCPWCMRLVGYCMRLVGWCMRLVDCGMRWVDWLAGESVGWGRMAAVGRVMSKSLSPGPLGCRKRDNKTTRLPAWCWSCCCCFLPAAVVQLLCGACRSAEGAGSQPICRLQLRCVLCLPGRVHPSHLWLDVGPAGRADCWTYAQACRVFLGWSAGLVGWQVLWLLLRGC